MALVSRHLGMHRSSQGNVVILPITGEGLDLKGISNMPEIGPELGNEVPQSQAFLSARSCVILLVA